ncbi:hypothetical protein [Streptomyces sp. NPDC001070]
MGGGEPVGGSAGHGLLDELILGVATVPLGAGAPLLPRRPTKARLRPAGVEQVGRFAYPAYTTR